MSRFGPSILGAAVGSALTLVGTIVLPLHSHASPAPPASTASTYKALKLFGEVFDIVRADYVDKPDDAKLVTSSIKGMLSGLDPHSSYMDAQSFRDMEEETSGKFGGVGMEIAKVGDAFKVVSAIDGTPAARANVRGGDIIAAVDGKPTDGLTLAEIAEVLRGPAGTKVELKITRKDSAAPIDVTLTREIITLQSVKHQVEGDDIGYIKISQFDDDTTDELKKAIAGLSRKIPKDRLKGYIVDLRNDPGGLLDQAVSVSDAFLTQGEIVSIRERDRKLQRFDAKGGRPHRGPSAHRPDQRGLGIGVGDSRRSATRPQARDHRRVSILRQGLGADHHSARKGIWRATPYHGPLFYAVRALSPGARHHARYRGPADGPTTSTCATASHQRGRPARSSQGQRPGKVGLTDLYPA